MITKAQNITLPKQIIEAYEILVNTTMLVENCYEVRTKTYVLVYDENYKSWFPTNIRPSEYASMNKEMKCNYRLEIIEEKRYLRDVILALDISYRNKKTLADLRKMARVKLSNGKQFFAALDNFEAVYEDYEYISGLSREENKLIREIEECNNRIERAETQKKEIEVRLSKVQLELSK